MSGTASKHPLSSDDVTNNDNDRKPQSSSTKKKAKRENKKYGQKELMAEIWSQFIKKDEGVTIDITDILKDFRPVGHTNEIYNCLYCLIGLELLVKDDVGKYTWKGEENLPDNLISIGEGKLLSSSFKTTNVIDCTRLFVKIFLMEDGWNDVSLGFVYDKVMEWTGKFLVHDIRFVVNCLEGLQLVQKLGNNSKKFQVYGWNDDIVPCPNSHRRESTVAPRRGSKAGRVPATGERLSARNVVGKIMKEGEQLASGSIMKWSVMKADYEVVHSTVLTSALQLLVFLKILNKLGDGDYGWIGKRNLTQTLLSIGTRRPLPAEVDAEKNFATCTREVIYLFLKDEHDVELTINEAFDEIRKSTKKCALKALQSVFACLEELNLIKVNGKRSYSYVYSWCYGEMDANSSRFQEPSLEAYMSEWLEKWNKLRVGSKITVRDNALTEDGSVEYRCFNIIMPFLEGLEIVGKTTTKYQYEWKGKANLDRTLREISVGTAPRVGNNHMGIKCTRAFVQLFIMEGGKDELTLEDAMSEIVELIGKNLRNQLKSVIICAVTFGLVKVSGVRTGSNLYAWRYSKSRAEILSMPTPVTSEEALVEGAETKWEGVFYQNMQLLKEMLSSVPKGHDVFIEECLTYIQSRATNTLTIKVTPFCWYYFLSAIRVFQIIGGPKTRSFIWNGEDHISNMLHEWKLEPAAIIPCENGLESTNLESLVKEIFKVFLTGKDGITLPRLHSMVFGIAGHWKMATYQTVCVVAILSRAYGFLRGRLADGKYKLFWSGCYNPCTDDEYVVKETLAPMKDEINNTYENLAGALGYVTESKGGACLTDKDVRTFLVYVRHRETWSLKALLNDIHQIARIYKSRQTDLLCARIYGDSDGCVEPMPRLLDLAKLVVTTQPSLANYNVALEELRDVAECIYKIDESGRVMEILGATTDILLTESEFKWSVRWEVLEMLGMNENIERSFMYGISRQIMTRAMAKEEQRQGRYLIWNVLWGAPEDLDLMAVYSGKRSDPRIEQLYKNILEIVEEDPKTTALVAVFHNHRQGVIDVYALAKIYGQLRTYSAMAMLKVLGCIGEKYNRPVWVGTSGLLQRLGQLQAEAIACFPEEATRMGLIINNRKVAPESTDTTKTELLAKGLLRIFLVRSCQQNTEELGEMICAKVPHLTPNVLAHPNPKVVEAHRLLAKQQLRNKVAKIANFYEKFGLLQRIDSYGAIPDQGPKYKTYSWVYESLSEIQRLYIATGQ